jgi:uncharacterized repeat protein (TIGR03803 family)
MTARLEKNVLRSMLGFLALAGLHARPAPAVTVTTLHAFVGTDGSSPIAGLTIGSDGNFYGTTSQGGSGIANPAGTVFRITSNGGFTSLYTFSFQVTGDTPYSGVVDDGAGTLYGMTRGTGAFLGNVFALGASFNNLHGFAGYFFGPDGSHPEADLLADGGFFYGTTADGGDSNIGTVFRIGTTAQSYTILHSFGGQGSATGAYPRGGLVKGGDDNFYGTTNGGGPSGSAGTVFRMTPAGAVTTIHTFDTSGGAYPLGRLLVGGDGKLYGTTSSGGEHGDGTIFRIATDGSDFLTLHSFDYNAGEGTDPSAGLIQASDGDFYGTTSSGGANLLGTIFRTSAGGDFETLHSFDASNSHPYSPRAPLVQGADGNLYGTTSSGGGAPGCGTCGTVFKVSAIPPPTTTLPTTSTTTSTTVTTIHPTTTTSTTGTVPTTTIVTTTSTVPTTVVASTTTVAVPTTTSTTLPCAEQDLPQDAIAGLDCAIGSVRGTLNAPPEPLCVATKKCNCIALGSALEKVAGLVAQAEAATSTRQCRTRLKKAHRSATVLRAKVATFAKRSCITPPDRGTLLTPEVADLVSRTRAVFKGAFCTSPHD